MHEDEQGRFRVPNLRSRYSVVGQSGIIFVRDSMWFRLSFFVVYLWVPQTQERGGDTLEVVRG